MSDAERVLRIYDEQVPGVRVAYTTDPATHYARSVMRHVLAIAEIAMQTENVPGDARFRILMTMAVGQPGSPVDAEQRARAAGQLAREKMSAAAGLGAWPDALPPLRTPAAGDGTRGERAR